MNTPTKFPLHTGLGVTTAAPPPTAPTKSGLTEEAPTDTGVTPSSPLFVLNRHQPSPVAQDFLAMRQIMEPEKIAVSFDPPVIPQFRDLLVLLADNVEDREQRESTLDDVLTHYANTRLDITDRIRALQPQLGATDMRTVKAALAQKQLLEEALNTLAGEVDQVKRYRQLA